MVKDEVPQTLFVQCTSQQLAAAGWTRSQVTQLGHHRDRSELSAYGISPALRERGMTTDLTGPHRSHR